MHASTALGLSLAGALALSTSLARADSAFLLQLGSFPTEEAANSKWTSLKENHAKTLGELPNRVAQVPVGEGKVIYRLQAGPISDRKDANAACTALKEDKLDCYLVETATLSESAPKQGLSAVRQSDGDELQLGKQVGEDTGMVRMDAAMPRMTQMSAPPAAVTVAPKTDADEAPVAPPPPISFNDAPAKPAEITPAPTSAALEEPSKAPDWKTLPKPEPMSRIRQPHYAFAKAGENTDRGVPPETNRMAEDRDYVAPATAPTMGSLGTLKLRENGEVLAASTPAVKSMASTDMAPVPNMSTEPVRLARQIAAPGAATHAAPQAIALLSPPPLRLDHAVNTDSIPNAGEEAYRPSERANSAYGSLTNSTDPNARVDVREAIPVAANALAPNLVPVPSERAENMTASQTSSNAYTPPAPWRGAPTSASVDDMHWAQFGHFINESTAFAFMDNLASREPQLTRGVRVRALRPLLNRGLGRHVALRVGPFRTQEEVDALCAVVTRSRQPCTTVQETGVSAPVSDNPTSEFLTSNNLQQQQPQLPIGKGAVFVQLGSYGSEAEAYNRFSALLSSRPKMLGGMRPSVTKPRGNSGGAVYRLRVGPFMDQPSALAFCSNLASSGTGCVLVKE